MQLTIKQEEGLRLAVARYKAKEKYTIVSGYAGSGKSTLIKFIINALNINPEYVAYVAYTGKAAQVLKQKGCPNATTAHKLLYKVRSKATGEYKFIPKNYEEFGDYKIVVVDEISMLPKQLWLQLLKYPVYIIGCGDPGQLPPIDSEETHDLLNEPHIFLDEIMRQAKESEIIRLSMHVRDGLPLASFNNMGNQVKIISKKQIESGMYLWADQILCATNNTRNILNQNVRLLKGFPADTPIIGDKVISLKNHWDFVSIKDSCLTNGCIGELQDFEKTTISPPPSISQFPIPILRAHINIENNDVFTHVPIDYNFLVHDKKTLNLKQEMKMKHNKRSPNPPMEFAYGYAITTWKAQGSEWEKVLGFEEFFPIDELTHKQYLYTLITRAQDKLIIVKK